MLCYAKAFKQGCSCLFEGNFNVCLCLSLIITGVVIDCRIVRWDLRFKSS